MADAKKKMVKVHILRTVGTYQAGQEIEVTESEAAQLTREITKNNGSEVVQYKNAVTAEEFAKMEKQGKDPRFSTVGQMTAHGVKNVTDTSQAKERSAAVEKAKSARPAKKEKAPEKGPDKAPPPPADKGQGSTAGDAAKA